MAHIVIPAKAGTQSFQASPLCGGQHVDALDSRLRGNDSLASHVLAQVRDYKELMNKKFLESLHA